MPLINPGLPTARIYLWKAARRRHAAQAAEVQRPKLPSRKELQDHLIQERAYSQNLFEIVKACQEDCKLARRRLAGL
jgi:hypothetical protein